MDREDNVIHIYIWNIYNKILHSHSKEWNNAICCNMDGPRDYHNKWSKSDKHHVTSLLCGIENMTQIHWMKSDREGEIPYDIRIGGIYKEMIQMLQDRLTDFKKELMVARWWGERWEEGIVREFGMGMDTRLYLKWIIFCRAHGTLLSVMWQTGWEEGFRENRYMNMYDWVPSWFTWNYHNIVY